MKSVDQLIDEVIGREGGYSNHPADKGGPTRWGVTQAVARANGYPGDMKDYPREYAVEVYRRLYWTRPGFDKVAAILPLIAEKLFDIGVNMGPKVAVEFLQRALNGLNREGGDFPDMLVDGQSGPKTLAALDAYRKTRAMIGERVLLRAIECLQGERYISLAEKRPANEAFLFGWLAHRIGNVA